MGDNDKVKCTFHRERDRYALRNLRALGEMALPFPHVLSSNNRTIFTLLLSHALVDVTLVSLLAQLNVG